MSEHQDWSPCFWCGVAQWGSGKTPEQALAQAKSNKSSHESSCAQRPPEADDE